LRPVVLGVCPAAIPAAMALLLAPQAPLENVAVRTCADPGMAQQALPDASRTAAALLLTAGIEVRWQPCHASPAAILVFLSSAGAEVKAGKCGRARYGSTRGTGLVRVEVNCVATVAFDLSRQTGNPRLAMPRHADLTGAVIAHEIGHLLGLRHSARGVMRERLGLEDILALRDGRLTFSAQQSATIRASLGRDADMAVRRPN